MPTIATWNINSVRLRLPLVARFLTEHKPDILCLQETKCPDDAFPQKAFRELGYDHIAISGEKGYNGVAILSKIPFSAVSKRGFYEKNDCRHIAVTLGEGAIAGTVLHNFYIPAGGDIPDTVQNPKYAHKLGFLDELHAWTDLRHEDKARKTILVGDLNVAPLEHDVWSHKQLLDVVSHTPPETSRMMKIIHDGAWIDTMRRDVPEPAKLYTWWSYRAADWRASNKGRRLDHIWASPALEGVLAGTSILSEARGWDRPSDHVPVMLKLAF